VHGGCIPGHHVGKVCATRRPSALTADTLSPSDPNGIFERPHETCDRLGIVDGGFEGRHGAEARGPRAR
jgi:hypothetical protein